ncbi:uncharacterized protein HMPREF1541_05495 [Cyphellophora europaea CBS 101466]|uniref:Anaphase-promoting complex subunit 2 n=1 Tax=Cyphellophora europaea (strain CBS 101466) TaxID=1220924 RepID=W2RS39_CYPE1|nr:uncharacterized protein HMPREF1541_05495 [Cyphellophora europaea CBS 101466]ETN39272.1 hypothetical protein HMPREF1541_05495 [Cyphellophora europaea CBS 101466]
MAKVVAPPVARNISIFNSVFTSKSVRAPTNRSTRRTYPVVDVAEIVSQLTETVKPLLGINTEAWTWGRNVATEDGEPFRFPPSKCTSMSRVRQPQPEDYMWYYDMLDGSDLRNGLAQSKVQLGAFQLQKLLADVLNRLVKEYVRWAYRGLYRADVVDHLEFWSKYILGQFLRYTVVILTNTDLSSPLPDMYKDEQNRWHATALTYLGALRTEELFAAIATEKPNNTVVHNIIGDLRHFVVNPATRTYLTNNFIAVLSDRTLQSGSSTIDILHLYIAIIRAFRQLDPKGVLLDRVAKHVRRYLRERDDTVKVIVSGLLSEPGKESDVDGEALVEVAEELHRAQDMDESGDGELDWDNMKWLPDPIDAAPDYMKSTTTDVIGSLTSLFESKEIFVKELQALLGDRLLQSTGNYEHEVSVLNHLKARFGDSALQACEVMLRDVLESSKVDAAIHHDLAGGAANNPMPQLHAKVLSRLFWPPMSDQAFTLPSEVLRAQSVYEKGFEQLKQSRQITWVPSLGRVDIELQLEDRTVRESVLPYQATVIYAFQDRLESAGTKTVSEIATEQSLSAVLVRSACIFWVSKRVLVEAGNDAFTVLETLPDGGDVVMADASGKQDASAAAAEAAAAQAAREAEEEERRQKMAMYHQFVVSMLTNQGAMPLPRIAMMLNIVVPGGFPFSNEELKDFLGSMVKDGQLEVGPGGNYKAIG